MKRVPLMILVANFYFALVDVMIWGQMFDHYETREMLVGLLGWEWVGHYWQGWGLSLVGMILVGCIALLPDWRAVLWFSVSTPLLAHSGFEDWLYYMMRGGRLPLDMPWLNDKYWAIGNATDIRMVVSIIGHAAFVILLGIAMSKIPPLKLPNVRLFKFDRFVLDT